MRRPLDVRERVQIRSQGRKGSIGSRYDQYEYLSEMRRALMLWEARLLRTPGATLLSMKQIASKGYVQFTTTRELVLSEVYGPVLARSLSVPLNSSNADIYRLCREPV